MYKLHNAGYILSNTDETMEKIERGVHVFDMNNPESGVVKLYSETRVGYDISDQSKKPEMGEQPKENQERKPTIEDIANQVDTGLEKVTDTESKDYNTIRIEELEKVLGYIKKK